MSRNEKNRGGLKAVLIVLILVFIAASAFMVKMCLDLTTHVPENRPGTQESIPGEEMTVPTEMETEPPTTVPVPEHVVSTASIGSMGDLLMHKPIFDDTQYNAAVQQADGSYNFESVFRYLKDYIQELDYAAVNLETTLAGTDNGYGYSGYPHFNCPDDIVDGAKEAGFDMLLTANNHSYDTTLVGYKRTLEVARAAGFDTMGTYASADETKWFVKEINGIKVGMLCYTYANYDTEDGRPSLNGNNPISEAGLCNYFTYEDLYGFYDEVKGYMAEMEEAGAEATMMYIHWGVEYLTYANDHQKTIAQDLCDLGIDVIVGGHPHVVEPVELLSSRTDPEHKTVCLYSMGNAVSNQRLGNISYISTAHTEDGILFTVTFEKYSDGTVYLAGVEAIPTWVNMHTNGNGKTEYNILPLDYSRNAEWMSLFEINDHTFNACEKSYNRTMEIVGAGVEACQTWLAQEKADREQYYYDLAFFPEKFATQATEETVPETTALPDAA